MMLWLGLLTLSIAIFVIECLLFIFGFRFSYDIGLSLAVLNAGMGFAAAVVAQIKKLPPESWLVYAAVAWPLALIHLASISSKQENDAAMIDPVQEDAPLGLGIASVAPLSETSATPDTSLQIVDDAAPIATLVQDAFTPGKAA